MTYLEFHLTFILPPILVLAVTIAGPLRRLRRSLLYIPALAAIAFVYTTPWDNYLVWRGVWGYGEGRVVGTLGYVPLEEYAFFLLQPILTGLWLYHVLARTQPEASRDRDGLAAGVALYGALAALGLLMLALGGRALYGGLILAWAAPVLAGQWYLAAPSILARRRAFFVGVAVPTLYLWVADAFAISRGIWHIAPEFTLGLAVAGLPFEEALFFLVTNLLVVQGLILFLDPPARVSPVRSPERREAVGR
jgi:lycopene beta-cyclase